LPLATFPLSGFEFIVGDDPPHPPAAAFGREGWWFCPASGIGRPRGL